MTTMTLVAVAIALVVGLILGAALAWPAVRSAYATRLVAAHTERDLWREQAAAGAITADRDASVTAALTPLEETMRRVERQVAVLERDRVEQYGELGERLTQVHRSTADLRSQTAELVGALNASHVRGVWGEAQLRRILEHAGMIARCDFDEQVEARSSHGARIRPDVVVRLPGERFLVIDAKAPLTSFLAAQADGLTPDDRERHLREHAAKLRHHVEGLAAKDYWSAFTTSPEMVVCFVPADSVLAAATAADPALLDEAMRRRVVLASPATLLALVRTVAFTWQQAQLEANARELLDVGRELYARLGTLGKHAHTLGSSLRTSVERYNALVGTLESRVVVSARRMRDLGAGDAPLPELAPIEAVPRPLTTSELLDAVAEERSPYLLDAPTDPRRNSDTGLEDLGRGQAKPLEPPDSRATA